MAGKKEEVTTPLLENILAQPQAFAAVARYQLGAGLNAIERASDLLRTGKQIVLTGMGASLFACIPLQYMLAARGISVSVVETAELLYFLEPTLNRDATIVLVSRSGESVELVKLLDALRGRACRTIGVVNVPQSALAVRAGEHILLNSPPDQLVAVQTYIATLVTLILLGAACLDELNLAASELPSALTQLSSWVPECVAASRAWHDFAGLPAPLYLLSRGPGLASAKEGALLMHEVAKSPATADSIAQFRHGFIEAADERFRAVLIGTQPLTAEIDRQFANDLQQMGAAVRWIGPLAPGSPVETLCTWPESVPGRFASVFEAIPLQLLAYRTAEARQIVPGTFRWASTVTASESGFPGLRPE